MKAIKVYDPPMCCPTGVCGTEVNPELVGFAATLSKLSKEGVQIERFNMSQQPMAFVQNSAVKALLEKEGTNSLPLILLDDEIYMKGRYPTAIERPYFRRAALEQNDQGTL